MTATTTVTTTATTSAAAAVTGVGVVLPGLNEPGGLRHGPVAGADPVDPAALIGKKGLRFKDRATQLGLCMAAAALTDAGLLGPRGLLVPGDRVGVVVSSNLGNADTVCRAVATIAEENTGALSPMDTPNASSNIIASEIAIRFGLRGPNLTVCNGVTSGLDALRWARLTLRSGRADHMVVAGVEPDNDVTRRLTGARMVDGGAAVVVSRTDAAGAAAPRVLLGPSFRTEKLPDCVAALADAVPGPAREAAAGLWLGPDPSAVPPGGETADLSGWGDCSGALGLLHCATAVAWADSGRTEPVYALLGGAGGEASGTVWIPVERAA
ncbi:beta-ketoacyl synthase N-terminal-like domain-containing protein [Streptomyces luomodiensis]|uniref:Beta-ketoacyl synthase N-terminal-like domain-containing protein n=1 Tax=Streptomyces luomodiensis TaxID=3026192 RepID=A0ABY9UZT4_9ACTN|nr:beta-ketoacyl synthase N-terminal-like domain-containing protein [Streptomyces sp. SCA4-21]WNE97305.1 beta-ketoacyl synthase N-terminal-like domain-containing protein [Streptomyces sp. SCA4-21]